MAGVLVGVVVALAVAAVAAVTLVLRARRRQDEVARFQRARLLTTEWSRTGAVRQRTADLVEEGAPPDGGAGR